MLFFTSDAHFGHANILQYCHRPFKNIYEMDDEIIRRWNSVVASDDDVYYLGDFSLTDGEKRNKVRDRLDGRIHFIPGSHDRDPHGPNWFILPPFKTIKLPFIDEITRHHICLTLCHYAMRSWPLSHYASWHLFGHHHGKLPPYGLSFDVGVDCWDFYPVSLDQVKRKMETLSPIIDYRRK